MKWKWYIMIIYETLKQYFDDHFLERLKKIYNFEIFIKEKVKNKTFLLILRFFLIIFIQNQCSRRRKFN